MASDQLYGMGLAVLFVILGGTQVYRGVRNYRSMASVTGTDASPVADLRPGETVAVEGTVVALDDDRAEGPLFGETGVAVATDVVAVSDSGNRRTHNGVRSVPFAVEDDTGRVRVEVPAAATVEPAETTHEVYNYAYEEGDIPDGAMEYSEKVPLGNLRGPPPDHVREFQREVEGLDDPEEMTTLRGGSPKRRYEEGGIGPGDEVYVQGRAVERGGDWGEAGLAIAGGDDPSSVSVVQGGPEEALTPYDRFRPVVDVGIGALSVLLGLGVLLFLLLSG